MKKIVSIIAVLFLVTSTFCVAKHGGGGNKNNNNDTDNTPKGSLVTGVTPGASAGTGTITISDGPAFVVDMRTTITVDGARATLSDVKSGMQVVSQTTAGSSDPEIDLKNAPAASSSKKGKKNSSSSSSSSSSSGDGN